MDLLPVELFDIIGELVDSQEVTSLRLVSKSMCRLATPFLTSKIHLIFTADSFSRMGNISKHPIIAKKITSIFYESDMLSAMNRETWERDVICDQYMGSCRTCWPKEEETAYGRECLEHCCQPRHSYTKEELEVGWSNYLQLYNEQQDLVRHRCGTSDLTEAMARLPNVTELRMSMGNNLIGRSKYRKRAFRDTLCDAFGCGGISDAPGVPQLMSMLQSTLDSGIKLQVLECVVNWRIFQCSKPDLGVFAQVLARVRKFKILLTAFDNMRAIPGLEMPEYHSFLQGGHVRDLITQADAIEDLEVQLLHPSFTIYLANVVGDHLWPKLTSITLSLIETTEEALFLFLVRHRSTLRTLHLSTVYLRQGDWLSLVPRMRSVLELEDCRLEGRLHTDNPWRCYSMDSLVDDERALQEGPLLTRCITLRQWFVTGGECPLTAAWSSSS